MCHFVTGCTCLSSVPNLRISFIAIAHSLQQLRVLPQQTAIQRAFAAASPAEMEFDGNRGRLVDPDDRCL